MKIKKILVGVDFGKDTEKIVSYASFFAKAFGASVHFLYVIDYLITPPSYILPYIEEEKRIADDKFNEMKKRLTEDGIRVETDVIIGRLHETFDTALRKLNADLLVLGFMSHALRRSSSEKLIKGLSIPMLVVRGKKNDSLPKEPIKIMRILCPTDFSEQSFKALEVAMELRDTFSSKLDVIHILQDYQIQNIMPPEEIQRVMQELRTETKGKLENLHKRYHLNVPGIIDEGEPNKKIISFAEENGIDLIVMGARGLGFIKEMLIGSVTDAVLKSSHCPVFVVH